MSADISIHGWTAVPRDQDALPNIQNAKAPEPLTVKDITLPASPVASAVQAYAKEKLNIETFHHSMRVFHYGEAIRRQHFSEWKFSDETYFLSCLLHDIGTTDENLHATMMSFEWYGGYLALDLLKKNSAPKAQAESVAEAIIRHQDIGKTGKITAIGQLLQLATIFDNMGGHPHLVHEATIKSVVEAYPRMKWSQCFSATIKKELGLKPWAHTGHLGEEDFPNGVANNKLMEPYD